MSPNSFSKLSTNKLLTAAAIIAIVSGAAVGMGVGYVIHYDAPQTRTFYLFDRSLPFDENVFGYPHDTFVPDAITVNKGDHVLIYFVDIERTPEGHTFNLEAPYTLNAVVYKNVTEGGGVKTTVTNQPGVVIGMGENATITFTASWAGTFWFHCVIHQPTMTGYLVVIG